MQIGLLRMFDRNIPETDIREIKQVLVKHLSKQLLDDLIKSLRIRVLLRMILKGLKWSILEQNLVDTSNTKYQS